MSVHLITSVMGSEKKIVVKCGEELPHKANDPLPPTATAWWSNVTCPNCLEIMHHGC